MRVIHKWRFKEGDIVTSDFHGSGVITSRRLQSQWIMDRPVKIVEKEMYTVMFGENESLISVESNEISAIDKRI
jgi:hypothetical protein